MTGKKELLASALHATGLLSLLPHLPTWRRQELRILTYHRVFNVADETNFPFDPALISASTTDFRDQIEYVAKNFSPIACADVLSALDGKTSLPRRAIVVTFDDGYTDTFVHAYPILRSLGVPATVFLSTGYVSNQKVFWFDRVSNILFHAAPGKLQLPGLAHQITLSDISSRRQAAENVLAYLKELPDPLRREKIEWLAATLKILPHPDDAELSGTLTWAQVREMSNNGIEFGSHAISHPILTKLDDAALEFELVESRACIERQLGKIANVIAYPEGGPDAFDDRVISAVKRAGYQLALTYIPGPNYLDHVNRFAMPRLQVERNTTPAWFRAMIELPSVFTLEINSGDRTDDLSTFTAADVRDDRSKAEFVPGNSAIKRDAPGWHVVLGGSPTGDVLCVDFAPSYPSEFFRKVGLDVHAIDLSLFSHDAATESGCRSLCQRLESEWLLPKGEACIDAFILHDFEGKLLNKNAENQLNHLLCLVNRLLRPGGYCYLGFRNGASLSTLGPLIRSGKRFRPGEVRDLIANAGFTGNLVRLHPFILADDRVFEILSSEGYKSVKNSVLWRERLKEWCYGNYGALRWAPAYGLVASKDYILPPVIDQLAEKLHLLSGVAPVRLDMKKCQLLWRKAIISYGVKEEQYGRLVIILTDDSQAIARREVEAATLNELTMRLPALQGKLPQVISIGNLGTFRYFVLTELPGMTIDRTCPGTLTATRNAGKFLSDFHAATIEQSAEPSPIRVKQITTLFQHAIDRYPTFTAEFQSLLALTKNRAAGSAWQTVWQHGDYKLENVILNPQTKAVVGVIDWELSSKRGLPFLDLLYLIAYNRSIRQSVRISDVYRAAILPWNFKPEEHRLLNAYQKNIGIDATDPLLWATLYLVHDVGIRFTFNVALPDEYNRLKALLTETTASLLAHPASRIHTGQERESTEARA